MNSVSEREALLSHFSGEERENRERGHENNILAEACESDKFFQYLWRVTKRFEKCRVILEVAFIPVHGWV